MPKVTQSSVFELFYFHDGLSFYAFFLQIKNDNPKLLMEVAEWWILTHQLDHFEKAIKIRDLVNN